MSIVAFGYGLEHRFSYIGEIVVTVEEDIVVEIEDEIVVELE